MRKSLVAVPGLLFFSGACALVYQTVWLRQFRLIFGASTAATAAVLAIFMAGLGLGSALLGRRADRHPSPLGLYALLEIGITAGALISQPLLRAVEWLYITLGGSTALGLAGSSVVRLVLAALILAIPTFLMGGTLPAAARAFEAATDLRRRNVAVLYATNTLGAVAGTLLSTFWLLEAFGNRRTLFLATLINGVVAFVAWRVASTRDDEDRLEEAPAPEGGIQSAVVPLPLVLAASVATGFAFLLMELVWYRMLGPILGGTTFMFGLILAIALLGIGAGGAVYAFGASSHRPTVGGFAVTCTAQAVLLILPFALGDRVALVANMVRGLGASGFGGHVLSWITITFFVVFPAAFVSGIQFPILIGLLGSGREEIGRHVGLAYAFNTMGSIAGSLAGGFGLIPLLSAQGCWRLVGVLLVLVGLGAVATAARRQETVASAVATLLAFFAVAGALADGPTAVWRHSGIGAGRAPVFKSQAEIREWTNTARRKVIWAADGRESSIAVVADSDMGFIVNGKSDGSARADAATQVMGGMIAATIHRAPRRALVIGLGTGSTAGWLANVREMERVDAVELEPHVLRVARDFNGVNHDVLKNPKVHVRIADAREVLLTTRERYDVIFSEPSNPFRAGIASLFTREFYEAVSKRLTADGIFVQWVQAYEIDAPTIRTIYATLDRVFPHVDTWRGTYGDFFLVCATRPIVYDANLVRRRVLTRDYGEPLHVAWRTEGAEGFFSHFIARSTFAKAVAARHDGINTDDMTRIEFGFARAMGQKTGFDMKALIELAQRRKEWTPANVRGSVDWSLALLHRASDGAVDAAPPFDYPQYKARHDFASAYESNDLAKALEVWDATHFNPINSRELSAIAEAMADAGRPLSVSYARQLAGSRPSETEAIAARLQFRTGGKDRAAEPALRAIGRLRRDPWVSRGVMVRLIDSVPQIVDRSPVLAKQFFDAFENRFASGQWDDARKYYRIFLGNVIKPCGPEMMWALRQAEPPPWRSEILELRAECYTRAGSRSEARGAAEDLRAFREMSPQPLVK